MAAGQDLRQVVINNSHPKVGFLKAATAQHEIAHKLCMRAKKNASYFDTKANSAMEDIKRLSKVQEFWLDKALEEVQRLRQDLKDAKNELEVNFICHFKVLLLLVFILL